MAIAFTHHLRSFALLSLWVTATAFATAGCGSAGNQTETARAAVGAGGLRAPVAGQAPRVREIDALVFAGDGAWPAEVASIEQILDSRGATWKPVSSAQLDAMSLDELSRFGIIVFPGGYGDMETNGLSADTHARLRAAVQERGVGYVGFCAGSFIAQAPAPKQPGGDVRYGLGVVDGPVLDYYHLESEGTEIAMTLQTFADGTTADILWYGGPTTPEIPGGVIARYPDGTPSITQIQSGNGFVILSGGHPTATPYMEASLGVTSSDGTHGALVWKLFQAALNRAPMPAF